MADHDESKKRTADQSEAPEAKRSKVEGDMADADCDICLVGLAVMGQNLILNMADHGFKVCAFNRTTEKVTRFMENEAKDNDNVVGAMSIEEAVSRLKTPRRLMLMVKAGRPVDLFIQGAVDLLEPGDIIIDGGNSHFPDTQRRMEELAEKGILFVGCGVSGGEEGARYGPSMMPGGSPEAWPHVKDIFQSIAAKSGDDPCCDWVGEGGAGHYVKMVHNGIEYGDMQMICEAYHMMKDILGLDTDRMSAIMDDWNKGELDSFLIEITRDILAYKDEDGEPLVEKILDTAGQKGTGRWTAQSSTDLGMPVTLISEAVFARCLSALKDLRVTASETLHGPEGVTFEGDQDEFIEHIRQALYASKIISYAQGFMLLQEAAREYGWNLNYGSIALMWRGGCIIRSVFLGDIKAAFDADPELPNLLLADFFRDAVHRCSASWRLVVAEAVKQGVPIPATSTALSFFDGFRSARLPANLLQAQRDYFGAHTFERLDNRGTHEHTNWTGRGGDVASSTYNA